MSYPEEFSREARARIVAARARADREFVVSRGAAGPITTSDGMLYFIAMQSRWIVPILGAFAHEACEIARSNIWGVDHVAELVQAHHAELAQTVKSRCEEAKRLSRGEIDDYRMEWIYAEIIGYVEACEEWKQYQSELIILAVEQSKESPEVRKQHPVTVTSVQNTGQANTEDHEVDPVEIERRARLLAEYKTATGNPSNRGIYTARNSNIHKPQFHEWLKGTLKNTSQTCQNFERFLRDKKRPIPRKA